MGEVARVRRTTQRDRRLRRNQTDAERAVWRLLRDRQLLGFKFRRQFRIHPYTVDFLCPEARLVIEIDGAHHAERVEYDAVRDAFLRSQGFRVVRFSDREALTEGQGVAAAIMQALELPPP